MVHILPPDTGAAALADPARPSDGQASRRASEKTAPHAWRTWSLGLAALLGAALIVMPVAFGMFDRAPKGAAMLAQFRPFMTTARLDGFQHDMKVIDAGITQVDGTAAAHLAANEPSAAGIDQRFPAFSALDTQWPSIDSTMTTLLTTVQHNAGNYQAVAALPSFTLFPWFFVTPAALIVAFSLLGLARPRRRRLARGALVALGIGLVLAPAVFKMFERAPKGGHMMAAFRHIETTNNVSQIQDYFATMAEGQGSIRLSIVPALERTGLTRNQIAERFPAVATLDGQWVHILNDMTPMIGAMSDNVANYQAIASLPPFALFPWFFVLPGLLVTGGALLARPSRAMSSPARASTLPEGS